MALGPRSIHVVAETEIQCQLREGAIVVLDEGASVVLMIVGASGDVVLTYSRKAEVEVGEITAEGYRGGSRSARSAVDELVAAEA